MAVTWNCWIGVHHPASRDRSALYVVFFNYKCTWRFRHVFSYITCLLRVKNLLTQWGASLKQSQRDNEELREMGNREWCSKPVRELPTFDSAFGDYFAFLSTFVPTDTLEHLKYCGKNTSLLMSLQSLQVLKGSECSHFWWMMLFTLERFTGPPIGNLINISYHMR